MIDRNMLTKTERFATKHIFFGHSLLKYMENKEKGERRRGGYAFIWKEYIFLYSTEKCLCLFVEGYLPRKPVQFLPSSVFPTNLATRRLLHRRAEVIKTLFMYFSPVSLCLLSVLTDHVYNTLSLYLPLGLRNLLTRTRDFRLPPRSR